MCEGSLATAVLSNRWVRTANKPGGVIVNITGHTKKEGVMTSHSCCMTLEDSVSANSVSVLPAWLTAGLFIFSSV